MWRPTLSTSRAPFSAVSRPWAKHWTTPLRRPFLTLAIETSCDDTSVALLDTISSPSTNASRLPRARLLFHDKVTAASAQFRGIHPLHAHESHQAALPGLLASARHHYEIHHGRPLRPDLVAATRGPGILACLQVGLNTAKGLALAWDVPFVGVHHMQAHALTPRLETALATTKDTCAAAPAFPFVSALVSGGHTLLMRSDSLTRHMLLAESEDIAVGDCLDKICRAVLPESLLDSIPDSSYGRLMEQYVFPDGSTTYAYKPPRRRQDEIEPRVTQWGWYVSIPTIEQRKLRLSFSGLETSVSRIVARRGREVGDEERRTLAGEAMRAASELIALRAAQALHAGDAQTVQYNGGQPLQIGTLVVSGGVAANAFLRHVLRSILDARGLGHVQLCFPQPVLCTDNAAMIAWAAYEMFAAGWRTDLNCSPVRRWPLDSTGGREGLLIRGWRKDDGLELEP